MFDAVLIQMCETDTARLVLAPIDALLPGRVRRASGPHVGVLSFAHTVSSQKAPSTCIAGAFKLAAGYDPVTDALRPTGGLPYYEGEVGGVRTKIEWQPEGEVVTGEGPHVKIQRLDPERGKGGKWGPPEKVFIKGRENYDGPRRKQK